MLSIMMWMICVVDRNAKDVFIICYPVKHTSSINSISEKNSRANPMTAGEEITRQNNCVENVNQNKYKNDNKSSLKSCLGYFSCSAILVTLCAQVPKVERVY